MSYLAVFEMHDDPDLQGRITAAAAMEGMEWPDGWVARRRWQLVAHADWATAWAYARDVGTETPGADPGVITDQMILSTVQAVATGPGEGEG